MQSTKGLSEYVKSSFYRQALGLDEAQNEEYTLLAQGEYNRNYSFVHPKTLKKLVLRINFASQMHLENQIEYEFNALKMLENSGRTPKPLFFDASRSRLDYGVMVMEFLEGRPLDYRQDLERAAQLIADIHSMNTGKGSLVAPENGAFAMLDECEMMFSSFTKAVFSKNYSLEYPNSFYSSAYLSQAQRRIRACLDSVKKSLVKKPYMGYKTCINTELNSSNFLISDKNAYLIDWEKPIFGEPAQDLAHFLAPTTSFWKTDIILSRAEIESFMKSYIEFAGKSFDVSDLKKRLDYYLPLNCLRGITWCMMAYIEYQSPNKEIVNLSTKNKLNAYLSDEFLNIVESYCNKR